MNKKDIFVWTKNCMNESKILFIQNKKYINTYYNYLVLILHNAHKHNYLK